MNTIKELTEYALGELASEYEAREIRSLCTRIFTDILSYTNIDIHIRKNEILDRTFVLGFKNIVRELKTAKPIQYILGQTVFDDRILKVDPNVLIPRPETEELVRLTDLHCRPGLSLLDAGTGSGCIAIALAKRNPLMKITAADICPHALEIARENALSNEVDIDFLERDILNFDTYAWPFFDIIVSNPPYVRESEKPGIHPRVKDFEPPKALFVPDENPLLFYKCIGELGLAQLNPCGLLFFEINEALGKETATLLSDMGYVGVEIKKDLFDRERFVKAVRKN